MSSSTELTDLVTLGYPGPAFRAVPEFNLDVPNEWAVTEFPGTLFAVGPPPDEPGVWANVLARHERLIPDLTLEDIAISSWQAVLAENESAVVVDERIVTFHHAIYVREAHLTMPEGATLTRIDTMVFAPRNNNITSDMLHMTWLHPTALDERFKPVYVKMLASLEFLGDGSTPAS